MVLLWYGLILTLVIGVNFSSGRPLVINSENLDSHVDGLDPEYELRISEGTELLKNHIKQFPQAEEEPMHSRAAYIWRKHRDKHVRRTKPSYEVVTPNPLESDRRNYNKIGKQNKRRRDRVKLVKQTGIFNKNGNNGAVLMAKERPQDQKDVLIVSDRMKAVGSKWLQSASRRQYPAADDRGNVHRNGSNPSYSANKGPEIGRPSGRFKQGHRDLEVGFERHANTIYEGNQNHKADALDGKRSATGADFGSIDRMTSGDKPNKIVVTANSGGNDIHSNGGVSLNIPDRFLKIPSSEKKLHSLITGILSSHPCIKQVKQDNGDKLNVGGETESGDLRDNVIKVGKEIKLCKERQQQETIVQKSRKRDRHKRKHIKAGFQGEKHHFDEAISEGKELSLVNGMDKGSRIQLHPGQLELNTTKTNWVPASQGKDTSKVGRGGGEGGGSDNLIRVSSPLSIRKHRQQFASAEEGKEQQKQPINYSDQFSTARPMANDSPSRQQEDDVGKAGRDFIISCSEESRDGVWTRGRINGLLSEVVAPECWHAVALREIYQMENELHWGKSGNKDKLDSEDSLKGVSEVLCYLIDETTKCLESVGNVDSPVSINNNENIGKVSESVTTITTPTTTTHKPMTSPQSVNPKVTSKMNEYKFADKLNIFDQSNGFNLDWEANMLFY